MFGRPLIFLAFLNFYNLQNCQNNSQNSKIHRKLNIFSNSPQNLIYNKEITYQTNSKIASKILKTSNKINTFHTSWLYQNYPLTELINLFSSNRENNKHPTHHLKIQFTHT